MARDLCWVFTVAFVFISFKHTLCLYPSKVVRDVKGDLLLFRCDPSHLKCSEGRRCDLLSVCRENHASCEDQLSCCMCRCSNQNRRPTYVDDPQQNKSVCMGNSHLPTGLNMKSTACRWRLVAKREDGKSCQKEDVPVIGLSTRGKQALALCEYSQQNATDLNDILSCDVKDRAHYFNRGKWHNSEARFNVSKNRSLFIEWERYSGVDSVGHIINIDVRCRIRGQDKYETACLIVKSSGSNSRKTASTTKPTKVVTIATTTGQPNTAASPKEGAKSSETRTSSARTLPQLKNTAEKKTTTVVKRLPRTTSQKISTTSSSRHVFVASSTIEKTSPTESTSVIQQDSNKLLYVKVAIGCSVFGFCASVMCVLLILLQRKRKRRKLQNKHAKGNPLYVEGAIIPVIATDEHNEMDKERKEMYQPLVQNSKCKLSNKNAVYQALRKKGRSLDGLNEYSSTPDNTSQYQSLQREKSSHGAASKVYQSLSNRKENERTQADEDERPSSLVYYSTPDTYKEPVMPVNKKLLKGYYEPGCVLLGQKTGSGASAENSCAPEDFSKDQPQYQILELEAMLINQETQKPKQGNARKLEIPEYHELESQPLYQELQRA